MRKSVFLGLVLLLAGCGGGGGGVTANTGNATLTGRVLDVNTGGAANPAASVQVGSSSTLTDVTTGAFALSVPALTTSALVSPQNGDPTYTFTFSAASGTQDLGDLWVGPSKVTVKGTVLDASTNAAISGATVSFAGVQGTTDSSGNFSLPGVAYSTTNQAAFWGIPGTVLATNYFSGHFYTSPNVADGSNNVAVGTILLSPSNSNNPPGSPYDINGRVLPIGGSNGTLVTLMQGSTTVRTFNVGADGAYQF